MTRGEESRARRKRESLERAREPHRPRQGSGKGLVEVALLLVLLAMTVGTFGGVVVPVIAHLTP